MLSGTLCINNVEVLNVTTNTKIVLLLFSINFTFSVEFFTNLRVEIITHWQAGSIRCTNMLLCLVVRKGAESTDSRGHPLFSIADSLFISVANWRILVVPPWMLFLQGIRASRIAYADTHTSGICISRHKSHLYVNAARNRARNSRCTHPRTGTMLRCRCI